MHAKAPFKGCDGYHPLLVDPSLFSILSVTLPHPKDHGDLLEGITEVLNKIPHTGNMDLGVIVMTCTSTIQEQSLPATERHSRQEIKKMLLRRRVRKTRPVYWRKLVEAGVPVHAADAIAKAIAQYDAVRQSPSSYQQDLINEYCRFVCRANLWRSQLLMHQAT